MRCHHQPRQHLFLQDVQIWVVKACCCRHLECSQEELNVGVFPDNKVSVTKPTHPSELSFCIKLPEMLQAVRNCTANTEPDMHMAITMIEGTAKVKFPLSSFTGQSYPSQAPTAVWATRSIFLESQAQKAKRFQLWRRGLDSELSWGGHQCEALWQSLL